MGGDHSIEQLARKFWTPARVVRFLDYGLYELHKSLIFFTVSWTIIGLLVSVVFFSGSLQIVLLFHIFGVLTGSILPDFLRFKVQQFYLAELRGEDGP